MNSRVDGPGNPALPNEEGREAMGDRQPVPFSPNGNRSVRSFGSPRNWLVPENPWADKVRLLIVLQEGELLCEPGF